MHCAVLLSLLYQTKGQLSGLSGIWKPYKTEANHSSFLTEHNDEDTADNRVRNRDKDGSKLSKDTKYHHDNRTDLDDS